MQLGARSSQSRRLWLGRQAKGDGSVLTSTMYTKVSLFAVVVAWVACHGALAQIPLCSDLKPVPPRPAEMPASARIIQVQTFLRHGDRTRAGSQQCWPDDGAVWECSLQQLQATTLDDTSRTAAVPRLYRKAYIGGEEDFPGNCATGQLTSLGYVQQLNNGAALRDAYVSGNGSGATVDAFLPAAINFTGAADWFRLRSDDSSRTIKSGQALFEGLYPPALVNGASEVVQWWTMSESRDNILPNPNICPHFTDAYSAAMTSPEAAQFVKQEITPFTKEINSLLGTNLQPVPNGNSASVGTLADCITTHACHKLPIPAKLTTALQTQAWNLTTTGWQFVQQYNNSRVARLGQGPLIKEMYGRMRDAMEHEASGAEAPSVGPPFKFLLYAGHDTGPIMPTLIDFGVFDNVWCPYASIILFELWEVTPPPSANYSVRMIYNGKVVKPTGCESEVCPFAQFAATVEDIVPTDAECGAPLP